MKTPANNASQKPFWAVLALLIQMAFVLYFWGHPKYVLAGSFTMIFSVTIIYYAVKSITSGGNLILALLLMFMKYPVIVLSMYVLFKQPDFNVISYAAGLFIILPCLVILSYR